MNLKQLSSVAALLLLAACAQPNLPQQNSWQVAEQVQDFSADGRLAVKVEGKGSYANFDWTISRTLNSSGQPKTLQLENAKFNIRLVFDTVNHSLDKNGQTRCAARK